VRHVLARRLVRVGNDMPARIDVDDHVGDLRHGMEDPVSNPLRDGVTPKRR
jgi:hypothetical protein